MFEKIMYIFGILTICSLVIFFGYVFYIVWDTVRKDSSFYDPQ